MKELFLFTDGSVDIKTKTGYGAYLAVTNPNLSPNDLKKQVKTKKFENTSSTRLELQTLLWALIEVAIIQGKVTVYTDSQTIFRLPARRKKLEKNDFHSKTNRLINNQDLYREFYRMNDLLAVEFVKVTGHQQTRKKDILHQLFSLVDKASRKALRNEKLHQ